MHSEIQESPLLFPDERLDTVNENLRLIQKRNGLTFGTDAYLLAAFLRPSPRAKAVDLGSGTGIIPLLLLAKGKVARVTAVEIQPTFAELISRNAALNGYADRMFPLCADLRTLNAAALGGEADVVLANPPYMRCDSGKRNIHDEKYIARHEVCGTVGDFCGAAGRLLRYGGRFACVWRPDRLSELMQGLQSASLEPKRMLFVHGDLSSEPCAVLVEAVKGGAPSLRIGAPLILYEPLSEGQVSRVLTPRAKKIYETGSIED